MKRIVSLVLLVSIWTMTFCGCQWDLNSWLGDDGDTTKNKVTMVSNISMSNVYTTFPEMKIDDPVASFTDGEYNYFFFKVGEIGRVPIAYSNTKFYQGIGTRTLTFETSQSVQQTVSAATEKCFSVAVANKIKTSLETELGIKNESVGMSVQTTALLEASIETTQTASLSEKMTQSISDTFTKVEKDTFELKPDSPQGFYRYTIYADCEIYAAIKANKATSTFEYTYLSFIRNDTMIEGWFYSEDGYFESKDKISSTIEELSVTEEMLNNIDLYGNLSKYVNIGKKTYQFSSSDLIETDTEYSVSMDIREKFDYELIKKMGYTTAKIRFNFTLRSPDGDCKAAFWLENGSHSFYSHDWTQITPSGKTFSKEVALNINDIEKYGSNLVMRFRCNQDAWWDVAKNSYRVESGTWEIWFE